MTDKEIKIHNKYGNGYRNKIKVLFPHAVCFLLGNTPASEVYMPTFRNTLFHLHRQVGVCRHLPVKMEQTECSETSAYKFQMPGNYPKESIQHLEHVESLKSRIIFPSLMNRNLWNVQSVNLS
jgi:hypothetical protein